jgi:hypothetical protein
MRTIVEAQGTTVQAQGTLHMKTDTRKPMHNNLTARHQRLSGRLYRRCSDQDVRTESVTKENGLK